MMDNLANMNSSQIFILIAGFVFIATWVRMRVLSRNYPVSANAFCLIGMVVLHIADPITYTDTMFVGGVFISAIIIFLEWGK